MNKLKLLGDDEIVPEHMKSTPDGFVYDFKVIEPTQIPVILRFREKRTTYMWLNVWEFMKAAKIQLLGVIINLGLFIMDILIHKTISTSISMLSLGACAYFGFKMSRKSYDVRIVDETVMVKSKKIPQHINDIMDDIKSSLEITAIHVHTIRCIEQDKMGHESSIDGQSIVIGKSDVSGKLFLLHHNGFDADEFVSGFIKEHK